MKITRKELERLVYDFREAVYEFTWNPGSIAAGGYTVSDPQTTLIGGLGSICMVACSSDLSGLMCQAAFTDDKTLEIQLFNPTTGAIDLAESTFKVKVLDI